MKEMMKQLADQVDELLHETKKFRTEVQREREGMLVQSGYDALNSLRECFTDGFDSIEQKVDEISKKMKGGYP